MYIIIASGLHIHFIKHESVHVIATEVDRFTHLAVPLICMAVTVPIVSAPEVASQHKFQMNNHSKIPGIF